MPIRPKRPCLHPGCPELVDSGYCPAHTRSAPDYRESAAKRGYDYKWQKLRLAYLTRNPLCVDCLQQGETTAAQEVHHIIPKAEGGTEEPSNLMALCKPCHSKRTARGE